MANSKDANFPIWVQNANEWARAIAKDNTFHYKKWGSDSRLKKCPICNNYPVQARDRSSSSSYVIGGLHGWNCIGFVWAVWHHGAGFKNKCNCGVINDDETERLYHMSNTQAYNYVKKLCGLSDIKVIIDKGGIKKSRWMPGDICFRFKGSKYEHTFYYLGNEEIADSRGSKGTTAVKSQISVRSWNTQSAKIIIRYVGPDFNINTGKITNTTSITGTTNLGTSATTTTTTVSSEPRLIPIGKSTCAQDVINATVDWAIAISKDNNFHYGKKPGSCHNGCYFCGTQPKVKKNSGIKGWEKTYCCNPFINAAFAHGGGEPTALKKCKSGSSWDHAANAGYNTSKLFENLGHPKKSKLVKGDVLCRHHGNKGHVALYIGDGKIVEASGGSNGDDNVKNSKSWNNSIRVRELSDSNYNKFQRVHRYIGNGGEMMHKYGTGVEITSTTDSGAGLNLQQTISKLYSSANYKYVTLEEEEESKSSQLIDTYSEKIKNILFNVNYTQKTETSAMPEPVVNNIVKLAEFEKDKPKKILQSKAAHLLSYPTLVEAPTIVLDFNGIKIGGYGNKGDVYPNYITSMSVKKINGRINQYTINLAYQVRPGEDPNFIDKLIARTGYTSPLRILYGDSNYPNAYYREESAVITDARHNEDTSAYKITYTIEALSSVSASQSSLTTFESKHDKPSNVIYKLLYSSGEISTNLLEIFPGMKNRLLVSSKNLIPTTDSIVTIGGMSNVSPLTYLSYLVACMNNTTSSSSYYLNIVDNSKSEFNGSYFEIKEIMNQNNTDVSQVSSNYYELDVGYPTNNYIMNFQLCNNNYWSLVYNYAGNIPKFEYGIDDNGDLITKKTNALYINDRYSESNLVSSNWWKQVTEYPISAKVTLKGLITPAILMSYIKVNALFYGEKDMASGLYVVTQQDDSISGSGYSTELTLLRVAGE